MAAMSEYISKQFSNPSGIGGGIISFVMNRQNRPMYNETLSFLSPSGSDCILDVGCGNGYVLNMIARKCDCTLAGIDMSGSVVKAAAKRCKKYIIRGKMTLVRQNANDMAFADLSFNKVYTINTVYFWEDLNKTMAEIKRVLKPGGIFINTLYSDDTLSRFSHTKFGYKLYTAGQLTRAGTDNGFKVNVEPILNGNALCYIYTENGK